MKIYLSILLSLCFLTASAGNEKSREKTVGGTFLMEVPSYMSLEQAKREAIIKAQNQAIEEAFGSSVSSSNRATIKNIDGRSETSFMSISEGKVRGVWLGDKEEPKFERVLQDGRDWLRVTVKGVAREIVSAGVEFITKTLRYKPDLELEASTFKNNDDFFLYFRSPTDGYLTVFLFDITTNQVFCMLPYQSSGKGAYSITRDEEYYLFAPNKAKPDDGQVDEFVLTCTEPNIEELSELYVIFSPNYYAKVGAQKEKQQLTDDLMLPSSLDYKDFNKWLLKYQQKDEAMQVKRIELLIKKN